MGAISLTARYAPTSDGLLYPIRHFMDDPLVSEIMLNRPREIFVEKNAKITRSDVPEYDEKMLENLFQLISSENKQEINSAKPLLSGSLLDGSRIQLVLPPTAKYHTFSIRRIVAKNFKLNDYESNSFYQKTIGSDIDNTNYELL